MTAQENIDKILRLFMRLGGQDEADAMDAYYTLKDFLSKEGNLQYLLASEILPFLKIGLQHHPDPRIRALTIDQLTASLSIVPNIVAFLRDSGLVLSIARALNDEYSVAKPAENLFLALAKHPEGVDLLFEKSLQTAFLSTLRDGEKQLRVMDLFADISQISEEYFKRVQTSFLDPIVKAFHTTSDVLKKLNFVEIIIKISATRWGLEYVVNSGLLQSFYNALEDFNNNKKSSASTVSRSDSFLVNKVITFVGQAAKDSASIAIISQLPFLDIISQYLEEFFERPSTYFKENTEVSITAVGDIGRTKEGLDWLFSHPNVITNYINITLSEDSSILIPAFHSLGEIFSSGLETERVESIYKKLHSPFMPHVMKYINKPFEDLRFSVYHFVQGLAHHRWGVIVLLTHPGFFEWLTNRVTEVSKPGKEWKFSIVQRILVHSDAVESTLGGDKVADLKMYITRGVFFMPTEAALEVATKV